MRAIAYGLFAAAIAVQVGTEVVLTRKLETVKIVDGLYETPKGFKVIPSQLEAQILANHVRTVMWAVTLLMVGSGVTILLWQRLRLAETASRDRGD